MPRAPEDHSHLAKEILDQIRRTDRIPRTLLNSLVDQAAEDDSASIALFTHLVEPLNDSFSPTDRQLYDRLFSSVILRCARGSGDATLTQALTRFGFRSGRDLCRRRRRSTSNPWPVDGSTPTVLIPSRVTLGADVAVTSVLIQRILQSHPGISLFLLGSPKLGELFGGWPGVSFQPLSYPRRGGLLARLRTWLQALEAADSLGPSLLVVDPDSRITQLGLLPLTDDPARHLLLTASLELGDGAYPIAVRADRWLASRMGSRHGSAGIIPAIGLRSRDRDFAANQLEPLGLNDLRLLAASLGTGGNDRKRLSPELESGLILGPISKGWTVLLDRGFGPDESARVEGFKQQVLQGGLRVLELADTGPPAWHGPTDQVPALITFQGGVGKFSALLARCSQYVGYDSLWQHVAAALGIPLTVAFRGHATGAFATRWRPHGRGPIQQLLVSEAESYPGWVLDRFLHNLEVSPEELADPLDSQHASSSGLLVLLDHLPEALRPLIPALRHLVEASGPVLRSARDRISPARSTEVARLALAIGQSERLAPSDLTALILAALLHGIGWARTKGHLSPDQRQRLSTEQLERHHDALILRQMTEASALAPQLLRAVNVRLAGIDGPPVFEDSLIESVARILSVYDAPRLSTLVGPDQRRIPGSYPLAGLLQEALRLWSWSEGGFQSILHRTGVTPPELDHRLQSVEEQDLHRVDHAAGDSAPLQTEGGRRFLRRLRQERRREFGLAGSDSSRRAS